MKDIRFYINKLPVNSANKLALYNSIKAVQWRIKYTGEDYEKIVRNRTFCTTNYYYGHEYWLKKYCDYTGYIYGMIEHGMYFGQNKSKVGFEEEWDLGSILTYGNSRIELLKDLYPDYNIIGVGPRIHYADMDVNYYNELKAKINPQYRTMALYPEHCTYDDLSSYDIQLFVKKAFAIAKEINAKNILLSLHPADFANGIDDKFRQENMNLIVVTGGHDQIQFLPRLKAIMSHADLIYSNAIGTHVGYSVYLNKPNIIDLESNQKQYGKAFDKEQKEFARVFDENISLTLKKEQIDFCDYFFGFSYLKSPVELYQSLDSCRKEYEKRFKRH